MLNCALDLGLNRAQKPALTLQGRSKNKIKSVSMAAAEMDLDAAGPATGAEDKKAPESRWLSTSSADSELENLWVCDNEVVNLIVDMHTD